MSGNTQVRCLGCNFPLTINVDDDSNVVHCDNCGTLSVIQPGMTNISTDAPVDALPFSIDDLLDGLSETADDADDSFALADDVQAIVKNSEPMTTPAQAPEPTAISEPTAIATALDEDQRQVVSVREAGHAVGSDAGDEGIQLPQDANQELSKTNEAVAEFSSSVPQDAAMEHPATGSNTTPPTSAAAFAPGSETDTALPHQAAEDESSDVSVESIDKDEVTADVTEEPVASEGPTSGADSVITGDLMFFFESLEDVPEETPEAQTDAAEVVGNTAASSDTAVSADSEAAVEDLSATTAAIAAVAAPATADVAKSEGKTDTTTAPKRAVSAQTPKVRNPLAELFASLKDETTTISHMSEDEEDFRTALKAYFESLPNHNLTKLAAKAAIGKIVDFQTDRLRLNLFHEKRSLVKRTVAYKGWAVPERKRDETNTRAWDISWKPPKEPSSTEESKIVSDSQELHGCTRCHQTGETPCRKCRGKGKFGCAACTATGQMPCITCAGTGQKSRERQIRGTRRCTVCAGQGTQQYIPADNPGGGPQTRTCIKCSGSGRESFVETETFHVACESCNASGKVPCQVCRGRRVVACKDCSGRGARQCRGCQGSKILVTYLEVRRTFETETLSTDLVGTQASDLFSKSFQPPFSVGHQQLLNWSGAAPENVAQLIAQPDPNLSELAESARDFLDESFRSSLDTSKVPSRTTAWKVELEQHSTRSVIYSLGKRRYRTIWDTRESDLSQNATALPRIFPHRSVITNWCLSQLTELRKNAEATGVRDAALQYQRLKAIAEVDPACQQAIAHQESTNDETLQQIVTASRTVKASQAQLIMYFTAAIILFAAVPVYFWLNDLIPVIGCLVVALIVAIIGWKLFGND